MFLKMSIIIQYVMSGNIIDVIIFCLMYSKRNYCKILRDRLQISHQILSELKQIN